MPQPTSSAPAPSRRAAGFRVRSAGVAGLFVALVAVSGAWVLAQARPTPTAPVLAVPPGRAEAIVRRTEVAFADAEGVWERATRAGQRQGYAPARVTFFSRASGSPCAPEPVSGPFYCPETGTAAFDLAYLDALGERLGRQRELGLALYAVRVASQHLQREIGALDTAAMALVASRRGRRGEVGTALALQADCLAGVWAAAAEPRLGPLPDGFWNQLVWSARNASADFEEAGLAVPPEFDVFAAGAREARDVAFAQGYASGRVDDCRLTLDG